MNKFLKFSFFVILFAGMAIVLNACKKDFDSPPGPSDPAIVANTTIAQLKAMHVVDGAYDIITSDIVISGTVVADDRSGNLYKQLFIQDETGGIQILLDANSLFGTYPVGRKVFVKCKDLCISDYNKTIQLGVKATVNGLPSQEGIPGSLISKYVIGGSINNPVAPIPVTLADLGVNPVGPPNAVDKQDRYLGSLIQLDGFEFIDTTTTYSDTSVYKATRNLDVKNCDGKVLIVRTSAYANFAGQRVKPGNGKLTAIYTTFGNTRQLLIRDPNDVQFDGPRCAIFEENFNSIGANNAVLSVPGWSNVSEVGTVKYQNAVFGSGPTKCAKVTAFSSGQANVTSWLISPAISLSGFTTPKLSFNTSAGFPSAQPTSFRVYISTSYNGVVAPSTVFTTQLPAIIASPPASGFSSFVSSGNLDLSAFAGQTIYIGFRYDGSDPTRTVTYEVDDVRVLRQ